METVKAYLGFLVQYVLPIIAIIYSRASYKNSKKVNDLEEKLKKYELKEIEKIQELEKKSCIEARIVKISKGKYRIKFWNSGKATAYNVNFEVEESYNGMIFRDKVPYETLEFGKSFEEIIVVTMGSPHKFEVTTTWEDSEGKAYSKMQIVSI